MTFIKTRRKPVQPAICEPLEQRQLLSINALQYHDDAASTGRNRAETVLTPTNVNSTDFGKLYSTSVDGQVYAQPLEMSGVNITTGSEQGQHNVVFVATQHDSLYAINAATGAILWQDSFLTNGQTTVPATDVDSTDITPEIGITSTPVIDPTTGILYLTAKTKDVEMDGTHYIYRLHAINVSDGSEALGGPIVIADTILVSAFNYTFVSGPSVDGSGSGSLTINGVDQIPFNAMIELQRPAVTLVNGVIYLGFGSHGDQGPYHGWVLGYNASNLNLVAAFNDSPRANPSGAGQGGIWESGDNIASDAEGNLYIGIGNGAFDTILNGQGFPTDGDYGDSIVKLAVDPNSSSSNQNINGWGLKVVDYFTPMNETTLNTDDLDLGSNGIEVLPASVGSQAHPNLIAAGGKQGVLYLIDADDMGKFDPSADDVVDEITLPNKEFSSLSYFSGSLYVGSSSDAEYEIPITNAQFGTPILTPDTYPFPGAGVSFSSNGLSDSIAWTIDHSSPGELRAYSATNLADERYTSDQAAGARDQLDATVKFTIPTIVNGMVYIGTTDNLTAFGLLSPTLNPPPLLQATRTSSTRVHITWTADPATNASGFEIDRSTNGTSGWTAIATLGATDSIFNDLTVINGQNYFYRVEALNSSNASNSGQIAESALAAPANPLASQGTSSGGVQLNWSAVTSGQSYQIFRSTTDDISTAIKINGGASATNFFDATAVAGVQYFYWIRARNTSGFGPFSAAAAGFAPLAAPGNFQAVAAVNGIFLSWNLITNASQYQVIRSTTTDFNSATKVAQQILGNQYLDGTAIPGVTYFYWVRARNPLGIGQIAGPQSAEI